ncbi:uncharacterized protein LOC123006894 [Tribolium madens]|uniref:uncharacterized protein LOC123006894 n=1 Tax=Tribolium madens TaxID=41895 RepID=UPI001CF75339|nr:uncharacterized protein LOC123006894 [Tribolium madens]
MKKICKKITNRISVPKKAPSDRKSGSYDLEAAQREYDATRTVPSAVYTSDSDSDSEKFQDASDNMEPVTYDVPRISFSFINEPKTPIVGLIKCGSDPNLVLRDKPDDDDDDGLYKIPRRFSQSLTDFKVEEFQAYTSDHSSIEHVSCSQVIVQKPELDYCKARSKLPLKLRRPTFLKKPRAWNQIRTKFSNIMIEHAAQQRVGAFNDKEKITLEEVYKTSKTKCKNAFRSTTRIFKRNQDSLDSENSFVKNDAFFAKVPLTPNDIEYKFDYNNDKVGKNDDEKGDFDFSSIKSAFRRSKFVAVEVRTGVNLESCNSIFFYSIKWSSR